MRERLVLRLVSEPPDQTEWLVLDAEGRPRGAPQRTALAELAALAAGRQVVLLVPGEEVLLCQVQIPTRNRRRLLQALPYALEDQVADDVATLHFATGPRQGDGTTPTAVIARAVLERLLERLQAHGVRADIAVPATLALPWQDETWAVLLEGERALVRTGPFRGLSTDRTNLPALLELALAEAGEARPGKIRLWRVVGQNQPPAPLQVPELTIDETGLRESLTVHAQAIGAGPVIDLLQGEYSRREQLGRLWRPWRAAAVLLGVWLVLQALVTGIELQRLSHERAALKARMTAIYRQAFPEARRVVLPRVQMEQQLKKLRSAGGGADTDALALLADIGEALHATPGVSIQALSFRDNRLDIDLEVKELQLLDRIKRQAAARRGISVEIVSASARGGRVAGRLRIERKRS